MLKPRRPLSLAVFLLLAVAGPLAHSAELLPRPAGAAARAAFSTGRALDRVVELVNEARSEILVAAYDFTSKPIAEALRDAHRRGVKVSVVADASKAGERYSGLTFLANSGVPVRTNARYAIHLHKFMVIDGKIVETGSFNFTSSAASRNVENVLILHDVPNVATGCAAAWRRLWAESVPVAPRY